MQSSNLLRRELPTASASPAARTQGDALPVDAMHEAANDDAAAMGREYRPNPLWAVNGAMAAFFIVAAVVLASG
jgi:hypothetical protein